jgi:4-hydroxy-2-oxoheptanedioate aldolase
MGRVLDSGAAGIMLPRLNTVDEVAEAVRHLRYPPAGDRGVATYNRACRFGLDPGALDRANAEVLGVPGDLTAPAFAEAIGSDSTLLAAAVTTEFGRARTTANPQ